MDLTLGTTGVSATNSDRPQLFSMPREQRKRLTNSEQEKRKEGQRHRNPYDRARQMRGGMLVKNGGPILVKTDTQAGAVLSNFSRGQLAVAGDRSG